MKQFFKIILILLLLWGCNESINEKVKSNTEYKSDTIPFKFKERKLTKCNPKLVALDTNNVLYNQIVKPEENVLDFNVIGIHLHGNGLGYAILKNDTSTYLSLVDSGNDGQILGVIKLPTIPDDVSIVDFCSSSCNNDKVFGLVKELKDGDVLTIKAWNINDELTALEELDPLSVDCTNSYYTDYD